MDEYTYQIVVRKELLTEEERAAYEAEPIVLAPWDPWVLGRIIKDKKNQVINLILFLFVHSHRDYMIPKKRAAIPTAKRARMIVIGDTFFLSNHMQRKVRRSPINPGINEFN